MPDLLQTLAVVGLFFLLLFLAAWFLSQLRGQKIRYPYAAKPVMTDTEIRFFQVLRTVVPERAVLLSKVRLADFLEVTERGENFLGYFGKIAQKHADFLLVDEETLRPLIVIELDDSTHRTSARTRESDDFKNNAYAAARVPIVRIPTAKAYDPKELEAMLRNAVIG